MIAIIDLDPMLHIVAYNNYKVGNREDELAVANSTRNFINEILKSSGCSEYLMFYQAEGHRNFRNDILNEYKIHRKTSDQVLMWRPVIHKVFESYGAIGLHRIESDDALNLWAEKLGKDYLIIENDKDLKCIPGLHYNPYKAVKVKELKWYQYTKEEALIHKWAQIIAGDSDDVALIYCGIHGMSVAKASQLISNTNPAIFKENAFKIYTDKFGIISGSKKFYLSYCMLSLLTLEELEEYNVLCVIGEGDKEKVLNAVPIPYEDSMKDVFDNKETSKSLFKFEE